MRAFRFSPDGKRWAVGVQCRYGSLVAYYGDGWPGLRLGGLRIGNGWL